MRLKEKIRKIDVFIAKKYDSINKSFFGKITIKLIGEIVLACFIACAVYLGSILYSDISATYVENKSLGRFIFLFLISILRSNLGYHILVLAMPTI